MYKIKSVDGVPGSLDMWLEKLTKKDDKPGKGKLFRKITSFMDNKNLSVVEKQNRENLIKELYS